MHSTLTTELHNGKKRIILTLSAPKGKIETRIMRSCASANFGEKILVGNRPVIEIKLDIPNSQKKEQKLYPPLLSMPTIKSGELIADEEEVKAAYRTLLAHTMLRSLGGKIPASIAKKFECRCGLSFVLPIDFLEHRRICPVLHIELKDVLDRGKKFIETMNPTIEKVAKKKEEFSCRCGHIFPKRLQLKRHQTRCSVLAEDSEVIKRAKDFIAKEKLHAGATRKKSKGKKNDVEHRMGIAPSKRNKRRKG